MLKVTKKFSIYCIVVVMGFLLATALSLAIPAHMSWPDDWGYYYAVKNFSQGQFTINDQTQHLEATETAQQGSILLHYLPIAPNKWALEKAPGYVFFLVPFELMGIPRWGNVFLALGMTIVTYILLKRLRDEKTACIGSLLMLLTPASMVMLNRTYMDTYASLAFLVMGGGLYIYYNLERGKLRPLTGGVLLFLAFLLASWSVVTRYTNLPIAAILALHYAITRFIAFRRGEKKKLPLDMCSVGLGIGLPLAALLLYDYFVFGSPLTYGYKLTPAPIKFAFQYIGATSPTGQSIPLKIIEGNLRNMPWPLFVGYPLLIIGIPGIIIVLYQKIAVLFKRRGLTATWASLDAELPWDILLILIGWFISVFGLYMMYEWTSTTQDIGFPFILMRHLPFIDLARFYLPGLLPIVVIVSLIVARFPIRLWTALLVIAIVAGSIIYAHSALGGMFIPH